MKKSKELSYIRRVYSADRYPNLVSGENPDFILEGEGQRFGVEVTEYYQDNSSGRYANIPHYSERMLKEGTPHPSDTGIIELVHPQVEVSSGKWECFGPAILQPILPPKDRLFKLGEVINEKNAKFEHYDDSLDYIDLLIIDKGDLLAGVDGDEMLDLLKRMQRIMPNLLTPFRNIYISSENISYPEVIHFWKTSSTFVKDR